MTPEQEAALRERGHIEGNLAEWLAEQVFNQSDVFYFGAGHFKILYAEEAAELGYDEDDPVILLRRESDGQVFEAEIDVSVRRVPAEAQPAEVAGQLRLPGVMP